MFGIIAISTLISESAIAYMRVIASPRYKCSVGMCSAAAIIQWKITATTNRMDTKSINCIVDAGVNCKLYFSKCQKVKIEE